MNKTVSDQPAGREPDKPLAWPYATPPASGFEPEAFIHDVDEAYDAAIVEYVNRNLVARGADPIDELPAHFRRMTLAEVEAGFAAHDALPATDDGPGRDQHGPHDAPTVAQRLAEAAADMTGPTVTVDEPTYNPLRQRISEILHSRQVAQILHEEAVVLLLNQVDRAIRQARECDEGLKLAHVQHVARQIVYEVREASAPEYTAPLTLPAECVDVPTSGPLWQIQDARDERGWHDVTASTECEDGQCKVAAEMVGDEVCIVLASTAWTDGYAHMPSGTTVDVRIPASVGGDR